MYSVLGVPRTADEKEIKRAFRKLTQQLHPDKNPGDKKAEEKFKEVSGAYEVLGDAQRRKNYDEFGDMSLTQGFDPERARAYQQATRGGAGAGARPVPRGSAGAGSTPTATSTSRTSATRAGCRSTTCCRSCSAAAASSTRRRARAGARSARAATTSRARSRSTSRRCCAGP
nr:J domain-containing protein [Nannocystis pusilla]